MIRNCSASSLASVSEPVNLWILCSFSEPLVQKLTKSHPKYPKVKSHKSRTTMQESSEITTFPAQEIESQALRARTLLCQVTNHRKSTKDFRGQGKTKARACRVSAWDVKPGVSDLSMAVLFCQQCWNLSRIGKFWSFPPLHFTPQDFALLPYLVPIVHNAPEPNFSSMSSFMLKITDLKQNSGIIRQWSTFSKSMFFYKSFLQQKMSWLLTPRSKFDPSLVIHEVVLHFVVYHPRLRYTCAASRWRKTRLQEHEEKE